MTKKKKLTKGDRKVLEKIFGGDQNMMIKIDKKEDMVTIITPLVRIRKKGCKNIRIRGDTEEGETEEDETEEDPE